MSLARILEPVKENLRFAAEILRDGGLVAFPTGMTVYGLGASALNERAVRDIFRAKGRPLTDPLIVHVYDSSMVLEYIRTPSENKLLITNFLKLSKRFWPGPLTIVLPSANLPDAISGGTGFVGFRMPNHPVALSLLREANLPVAAPSANKFGHISPTSAEHVFSDLGDTDVIVLSTDIPCQIGIESTVIGLFNDHIQMYRLGAITREDIHKVLDLRIDDTPNHSGVTQPAGAPQVSPGQLLTHYAPDQPTYVVLRKPPSHRPSPTHSHARSNSPSPSLSASTPPTFPPRQWGFIDCGGQWKDQSSQFCTYVDLSPSLDGREVSQSLFRVLRTIESDQRVKCLVLAQLPRADGVWGALHDRIRRASSGREFLWAPDSPP